MPEIESMGNGSTLAIETSGFVQIITKTGESILAELDAWWQMDFISLRINSDSEIEISNRERAPVSRVRAEIKLSFGAFFLLTKHCTLKSLSWSFRRVLSNCVEITVYSCDQLKQKTKQSKFHFQSKSLSHLRYVVDDADRLTKNNHPTEEKKSRTYNNLTSGTRTEEQM